MSTRTLTLRFTRKDPASAKDDDITTITCVGPDRFELTYTYGLGNPKFPKSQILSSSEVFRWLRTVIRLLEADTDPFADIQVQHPLMPDVLLDAKRVGDHYHRLLDALEFFLDTVQKPANAMAVDNYNRNTRTHTFFYDTTETTCCDRA